MRTLMFSLSSQFCFQLPLLWNLTRLFSRRTGCSVYNSTLLRRARKGYMKKLDWHFYQPGKWDWTSSDWDLRMKKGIGIVVATHVNIRSFLFFLLGWGILIIRCSFFCSVALTFSRFAAVREDSTEDGKSNCMQCMTSTLWLWKIARA